MAKKNEIAVVENYNLMTIAGELAEAVAEEMDGLGTIPFDRVKIPSGGQTAFEIPGETEDDSEIAKTITGVIIHHHPVNAYWKDEYTGGNQQPDCSSYDGKKGVDTVTGEIKDCASCPMNQFGTGTRGRGKACKNIHRCYILQEGNPVPLILPLPPTSLKSLRDYIGKKLLLRGMRSHSVITEISLKKEKGNGDVPDYSKAVFVLKGKLSPNQAKEAEVMRQMVIQMTDAPDIDTSDYNTGAGMVDASEFQEVGSEADLPFK